MYSLHTVKRLKSDEAINYYLEGWIDSIQINETKPLLMNLVLPLIFPKFKNNENIMQKYALNLLFFDDVNKKQIDRLDRILNLQWAIDLKKELDQIPN